MPWTPRCDALLDQSLGHGACKCLPRRAAHTWIKQRHSRGCSERRPDKKQTHKRGDALCCRNSIDCSLPLDTQLRANKSVGRASLRARCRMHSTCSRHIRRIMRCFVGSAQPTRGPNLTQVCYQRGQARRSRNNQACGAGCAPGGVRVVLANGHPETNTTTDAITLLLPSAIALATRRTWRTCRARLRAEQHRCNQLPSHRSSARCRTEPSTRPHRGKL